MKKVPIILFLISLLLVEVSKRTYAQEDPEYVQVTLERADKIVKTLNIQDPVVQERTKQKIAKQYRDLSALHEQQDDRKAEAKQKWSGNPEKLEKKLEKLESKSDKESQKLKQSFVSGLSEDLNEEQIVGVKDGLTYSVAPNTYKVYLQMLPELTEEQKGYIWENLLEARENAMMAGSSKDKHGWFGKYKGRITDPANDRTYTGNATLSGNSLAMQGCVAAVFCRTQNWQRQ
jgi:hypothetical protein